MAISQWCGALSKSSEWMSIKWTMMDSLLYIARPRRGTWLSCSALSKSMAQTLTNEQARMVARP
jgi:hypothetical protein